MAEVLNVMETISRVQIGGSTKCNENRELPFVEVLNGMKTKNSELSFVEVLKQVAIIQTDGEAEEEIHSVIPLTLSDQEMISGLAPPPQTRAKSDKQL